MAKTIVNPHTTISMAKSLGKTVIAGFIIAFLQIMIAFSLAKLLFSGSLAPHLASGIGLMIVSLLIGMLITALMSSQFQILPSMQSSLVLILVAIAGNLAVQPGKSLYATAIVTISLSALLVGVVYYVFGRMKLVRLVRYVPYPVIGGFLAGNGWLLIHGALEVMLPFDLRLNALHLLLSQDVLLAWLPGVLIAIALFFGLHRYGGMGVFPTVLLASGMIIYAVIAASGISIADAQAQGILLGDIGTINYVPVVTLDFDRVDWVAIGAQLATIATLVTVAVIHLSLNLTGIELVKQDDFDINEQVRANGVMNLLAGLAGGIPSFSSTTVTAMNHRIGGTSRLLYLVVAIMLLMTLLFGSAIIGYIPVAVLGGLLIFLGMEFIDSWMIQGYRKFTRSEYAVALLIMLTVAFVGFIEGVALGLFVMVLVFVGTYSRISIVYRASSARNLKSAVEHNPRHAEELKRLRDRIYVLELTGYLFFGTAEKIVARVRDRIQDKSLPGLSFFIIDFRRVAGVDSSALQSLNKVIMLAERNDFDVIFSDFENNTSIIRIIQDLSASERLEFASDLDHSLERCERQLLEISGVTQAHIASVIWMQLVEMGMSKQHARQLQSYMERNQYKPEQIIIEQDAPADEMYFVEIGQVTIMLNFGSDQPIRLRTMGMGTIVGEIGFFLNQKRTATVIADTHAFIWTLTKESLSRMKEEDPELAFAFEGMMLRVVAKRLVNNNNLLDVLR